MSCFNNCYLPQPPRDWSRVQNICSYENNVPYKEQTTIEMLNKGNILQYKENTSLPVSVYDSINSTYDVIIKIYENPFVN